MAQAGNDLTVDEKTDGGELRPPLRAGDWLWRPWYAKLWWVAIPIYWAPAGGPTRIAAISDFYESAYALVPNLVFLPLTAALILGFGYLRRLFDEGEQVDLYDEANFLTKRRVGFPHPTMDEFNPRSGPRWIGNHTRKRLHQ
jgi:hypothetical protein